MPKGATDNTLVELVFRTGRCFKECIRKTRGVKLSMVQFESLRFIGNSRNPTMHDLAETFAISAPAVTLIVDGLEKEKLVKRVNSKEDRRSTTIVVTPKGKSLMQRARKHIEKQIAGALMALSQNEKNTLAHILMKIGKS